MRPILVLGLALLAAVGRPLWSQEAVPTPIAESAGAEVPAASGTAWTDPRPSGVVLLPPSGDAPVEPKSKTAVSLGTLSTVPAGPIAPEEIPAPPPSAKWSPPFVPTPCMPNLTTERALRRRALLVPVLGVVRNQLRDSFKNRRSGGRTHHAIDIMAPRNTPILAVEDGTIVKLTRNRLGGITLYQLDPTGNFAYYYAHLERYAPGLSAGQTVQRGQVIGYVGTSGNAPKHSPHLHFAIYELPEERTSWLGQPVNPFDVLNPGHCTQPPKMQIAHDRSPAGRDLPVASALTQAMEGHR